MAELSRQTSQLTIQKSGSLPLTQAFFHPKRVKRAQTKFILILRTEMREGMASF